MEALTIKQKGNRILVQSKYCDMDNNYEISNRQRAINELEKLIEDTEESQHTFLYNKLQLIKNLLK